MRSIRQKETKLINELEILDIKICSLEASNEEISHYHDLKTELERITEEKAKGAWVRSRLEFVEKHEKSNTYFFNKSKESFKKKTISSLDIDGTTTTDHSVIMNHLKCFYSKLYASNNIKPEEIKATLNAIQTNLFIAEEHKLMCESEITLQECWLALKCFKQNKSPGCDGLTSEFYQKFWKEIGPKLVETLNSSKQKGHLSQSQRRGVITLLEKRGKDSSKIKNWRPVSLLNVDYKILTKTLAKRIEKTLPNVINNDQSGFLKGRYIGEGVRFVEDLIDLYDNSNQSGIILQLDFEKAFDSVEWDFLFATLEKFGFGQGFISWIKCCYTDIVSCVMNNGYSSEWFQLSRGVRQGCPLSVYLFLLCVEIMACMVRENKDITGLVMNGNEHKVKQFADDCTCTLKCERSVHNLIKTINIFSNVSGLKLNLEKSLLFYLGPWRNRKTTIMDMEVAKDTFNMLGICVGRDRGDKSAVNFTSKIDKMSKKFQIWSQRQLTIVGRNLVSKTFGVSNLIYSLSQSDCELSVITKAQSVLNSFIWKQKPAKVKHSAMISDKTSLRTVDIYSQSKWHGYIVYQIILGGRISLKSTLIILVVYISYYDVSTMQNVCPLCLNSTMTS